MNNKLKTKQFKKYNEDYNVKLIYDKCKSGESQYGKWYYYGIEFKGEHQGVFADETLHRQLKKYSKGTKLIIRKNKDNKGISKWVVALANKNTCKSAITSFDDRTMDIHRQVALKISTNSIGQNRKTWTDSDLMEIKVRMNKLLEILDGVSHNE